MVATKQKLSIEFTNLSLLLFPSPIFLFFVPLLLLSNFIHTLHPKYCNITSMTSWEWHHHMTPSFKFHWSSLDQNTCIFFSLSYATNNNIWQNFNNTIQHVSLHTATSINTTNVSENVTPTSCPQATMPVSDVEHHSPTPTTTATTTPTDSYWDTLMWDDIHVLILPTAIATLLLVAAITTTGVVICLCTTSRR